MAERNERRDVPFSVTCRRSSRDSVAWYGAIRELTVNSHDTSRIISDVPTSDSLFKSIQTTLAAVDINGERKFILSTAFTFDGKIQSSSRLRRQDRFRHGFFDQEDQARIVGKLNGIADGKKFVAVAFDLPDFIKSEQRNIQEGYATADRLLSIVIHADNFNVLVELGFERQQALQVRVTTVDERVVDFENPLTKDTYISVPKNPDEAKSRIKEVVNKYGYILMNLIPVLYDVGYVKTDGKHYPEAIDIEFDIGESKKHPAMTFYGPQQSKALEDAFKERQRSQHE